MTANVIASSVLRSSQSSVQPSVYWRIGDEPMNVPHFDRQAGALRDLDDRRDVGDVRARGAVGAHLQLGVDDLARQALDVARRRAGRRRAGRCRRCRCRARRSGAGSRSSASIVGVRTDGDCSPSRSVSSSSITRGGLAPARRSCSSRRSGIRAFTCCAPAATGGGRGAGGRRSAASHTRGVDARRRGPSGRKPSLMVSVGQALLRAATICDRDERVAGACASASRTSTLKTTMASSEPQAQRAMR